MLDLKGEGWELLDSIQIGRIKKKPLAYIYGKKQMNDKLMRIVFNAVDITLDEIKHYAKYYNNIRAKHRINKTIKKINAAINKVMNSLIDLELSDYSLVIIDGEKERDKFLARLLKERLESRIEAAKHDSLEKVSRKGKVVSGIGIGFSIAISMEL